MYPQGRGTGPIGYGGVLRALPRDTDSPLMAEKRKHAPDHRYTSDDEIVESWISTAKLGMQLSTWELKIFASLLEAARAKLRNLG